MLQRRGKLQTRTSCSSTGSPQATAFWTLGEDQGPPEAFNIRTVSNHQSNRLFLSASLKNPGNCWTGSVLWSSWTMVRHEPSAEISKWKEVKHHMGFGLKGMIPNPQFWNGRISPKRWFMSLPKLCSRATTWRHDNTNLVSLWSLQHYNVLSLITESLRLDKPFKIIKSNH